MIEELRQTIALLAGPVDNCDFMTRLRSVPFRLGADPAERDAVLILQAYDQLAAQVRNLTRFSALAGRLMEIALAQLPHPERLLALELASPAPPTARTMSRLLFASLVASRYGPLTDYAEAQIAAALAAGSLSAPLLVGLRAFFTATHLLHSPNASELIPTAIRPLLLRGHPKYYADRLSAAVEAALTTRAASVAAPPPPAPGPTLHIVFTLEDFIFDRLNTLTKLYCDYFLLLAQRDDVRLSVRVFRITYEFDDYPFPATWDPLMGDFAELMRFYFGPEAEAALARIDFRFVPCWGAEGDFVDALQAELAGLAPDVCVTCLDRFHSFLEAPAYALAPLLQIEIVNGSRYIRQCDGLIPNGAIEPARRGAFALAEVPLPHIPFPIARPISKAELGVADDLYLIAVVGKNFPKRLESEGKRELSHGFARSLAGLLDGAGDLAVLAIGEEPAAVDAWLREAGAAPDRARWRVIGFTPELRATLAACDLIVNPPIRGGGRGIALAVCDRLPTLIFAGADAANFVPAAHIAAGLDEFVAKVEAYRRRGPGFRETYQDATGAAPFSPEYNARVVSAFVAAARSASARGFARLATSRQARRG